MRSFDNKSWFKAGRIVQYLITNKEKDVIRYGIGFNENVFEIRAILRHFTKRNIELIPLKYGFEMHLIKK